MDILSQFAEDGRASARERKMVVWWQAAAQEHRDLETRQVTVTDA